MTHLAQDRLDNSAIHKAAGQAFFPVGTTPRGRSSRWLHSRLMGVSGIVPGKIMQRLGTMRPAALRIALLQCYSQSRRPHGSRPFHNLTGTIPLFHRSTEKCPIGCEWELPAGTPSRGGSSRQFFGNGRLLSSRRLCE